MDEVLTDEKIIGELREEIKKPKKVNRVHTPAEWAEALEYIKTLPHADVVKGDWNCSSVIPYKIDQPQKCKRIPRKWFAPFYNLYCKVKTCFE